MDLSARACSKLGFCLLAVRFCEFSQAEDKNSPNKICQCAFTSLNKCHDMTWRQINVKKTYLLVIDI